MANVADVLKTDRCSPVIYLRPFGEAKARTGDVVSTGETSMTATAKAKDFLLAVNAVGPLVSIAEPDRRARMGYPPPKASMAISLAGQAL